MRRALTVCVFVLGLVGGELIAAYYFPDNVGAMLLGGVVGFAAATLLLQAVFVHRRLALLVTACAGCGWAGFAFSRLIGRGTTLSAFGALWAALLGLLALLAATMWREDRREEREYNSDDLDGTYIPWPR